MSANYETLAKLHAHHVSHVPFENLDVHFGNRFDLDLANIYRKVVDNNRGGFCYELNQLFNWLLNELGFPARIIAARTFDDSGNLGPKFDHMSIYLETDKPYLLDVGYGDLFITPLEIRAGVQSDGRNYFRIDHEGDDYCLSMSNDGESFRKRYTFSLGEVKREDFDESCQDKQINPASYFVKNVVCTMATETGRVTIFNDKFIERQNDSRSEQQIEGEKHLREILASRFGIVANPPEF